MSALTLEYCMNHRELTEHEGGICTRCSGEASFKIIQAKRTDRADFIEMSTDEKLIHLYDHLIK